MSQSGLLSSWADLLFRRTGLHIELGWIAMIELWLSKTRLLLSRSDLTLV